MNYPPLPTFNYGWDTVQFCVQRLKLLASDEALAGALILVRDGGWGRSGEGSCCKHRERPECLHSFLRV